MTSFERQSEGSQRDKAEKKVHFDDSKSSMSPDRMVREEYEAKFGKMNKFVLNDSPIDRYYKLYVVEERARALRENPVR